MIPQGRAPYRGGCSKWRSTWKYPVPEAWLTIGSRGSSGRGRAISNRNAKHPVNALLNYAYPQIRQMG